MLCRGCRRVATNVARQLIQAPHRLQSTVAPLSLTSLARVSSISRRAPILFSAVSSSKYSTSSEAVAASTASTASTPASPATSNTARLPDKPDYLDEAESSIWDKLTEAFAPTELAVQDISGGCGSMYGIEIASEKFRGINMLKQQRMVNAVLGEQMKGWHGVQLRTKVPS